MNTMKDYHDLYLKVDRSLLAFLFENSCIKNSFELDPVHYLSTPGYSWDAMLKLNKVNV